MEKIHTAIQSFGSQYNIETGHSMTLLWEAFRPLEFTSETAFKNYTAVADVARRFDSVSDKMAVSNESAVAIRELIIETVKLALVDSEGSEIESMLKVSYHWADISAAYFTNLRT